MGALFVFWRRSSRGRAMKDPEQLRRLRQFWGAAIFSLGVLWGAANIVYSPIAALTSIVGSSWLEVFVIAAGGLLTCFASVAAFYRRGIAAVALATGGFCLLLIAIAGQRLLQPAAHGLLNLLLLYGAGGIPLALGVFGVMTEQMRWPRLRNSGHRIQPYSGSQS